jgi:hypothetical protein
VLLQDLAFELTEPGRAVEPASEAGRLRGLPVDEVPEAFLSRVDRQQTRGFTARASGVHAPDPVQSLTRPEEWHDVKVAVVPNRLTENRVLAGKLPAKQTP